MLSISDLITLPYTPDLTQAGIGYACRSLPYTYDRMGGSSLSRLRRIVAGVAVELAFRRHLTAQGVPHDTLGATPFTDPDRYDVALGRRRCDVKSFEFFNREVIRKIHHQPAMLLDAAALVPADQFFSDCLNDDDLYIFAFATALVTDSREALQKALQAEQPVYWMHTFPKVWTRPEYWRSLGRLALKAEAGPEFTLELGGQDETGAFQTETVRLEPGKRVKTEIDFFTLGYAHTGHIPDGRVGIHSPVLDQTYLILPNQWGNIWVYGMDVILAGYMTRGEFRRRSQDLPLNSRVLQYVRTRTKNRSLLVSELNPLGELYERVKAWASELTGRAILG